MMNTDDIGDVLLRDFKSLTGIQKATTEILTLDDKQADGVGSELIAVHVKKQETDVYWKEGFVEVNLCVPDFKSGARNIPRTRELESIARAHTRSSVYGEHEGITYRYSAESIGIEREERMKCHYVNIRLLFEVFNII